MILLLFGSTAPYILVRNFTPKGEAVSLRISGEANSLKVSASSSQKSPQAS